MDSIDYGKGIKTKLIAWKDKIHDLTRKVARRGSKENEKVMLNNQELNMPITEMSSRIAQLINECRTEWTPQGKIIDNGFVDHPGRYVLRPRLSWERALRKRTVAKGEKAMGENLNWTGIQPREEIKNETVISGTFYRVFSIFRSRIGRLSARGDS
jgi:hypothetical protein